MVTQRTLADLLIEAGFEPEAALRASELLEQDLTGLAKQAEVDLRFDATDQQIKTLATEVNLRFDAVDRDLKALDTRIDDLKDSTERESRSLGQRITDLRTEFIGRLQDLKDGVDRDLAALHRRLDDFKDSVDRRFTILTWSVLLGFGGVFAVLGYIITRLPSG